MRASQRKRGRRIVIEGPAHPCGGVVTISASIAEHAFVHVVPYVALGTIRFHVLVRGRKMASRARQTLVGPCQRKHRKVVAEQDILIPGGLAVALLAGLAQLCLVWIQRTVAVNADSRGDCGNNRTAPGMATGTGNFAVSADQREICVRFVIETDSPPVSDIVTLRALLPVGLAVHVIGGVTVGAGCGKSHLQTWPVTSRAGQICVVALQGEIRRSVIETDLVPVTRDVARLTLTPVCAQVPILTEVARHALWRDSLEPLVQMATGAGHVCMGARQGKSCALVVEHFWSPAGLLVTALAVVSERSLVHVIVATSAVGTRFAEACAVGMTSSAMEGRMPARQWKVCLPMIEVIPIQSRDVRVAPFMVAVTTDAVRNISAGDTTVQSAPCGNVPCDVFVTVETQG